MTTHVLTVGFIPLLDCAALVAAQTCGFAADEGLELILVRESSWANIRDRLIVGHFDAAHMLGPMTVASTLGIGHLTEPMIAPISLGLGGNAITVASSLWSDLQLEGAKPGGDPTLQGAALRRIVGARNRSHLAPLTFGMVYPFSCHNYELRYWLAAVGIDPDRDVRLVVIPPPLLADAMRAGQIDGFCVGEPWNSVAVEAGIGAILAPTTAIWPSSPEKVLGCRAAWAERHPDRLAALLRAIYRAARWCEDRDNHPAVARLLADERYVGAPAQMLHRALVNRLPLVRGAEPHPMPDFFALARHCATFPWVSHAAWYYSQMVRWRQVEHSDDKLAAARATYRPDLYRNALASLSADVPQGDAKVDRFFDGRVFDAANVAAFFL
jgi:NitT/TauT family transport system ATP-binding protein